MTPTSILLSLAVSFAAVLAALAFTAWTVNGPTLGLTIHKGEALPASVYQQPKGPTHVRD